MEQVGTPIWPPMGSGSHGTIGCLVPALPRTVLLLHDCLDAAMAPTPWRELVDRAGVEWRETAPARSLHMVDKQVGQWPLEGVPGARLLNLLSVTLADRGTRLECLAYWEPFRALAFPEGCWLTSLDRLVADAASVGLPDSEGPHAVWATDGSWYLASDVDLPFSVLACGEAVADALLVARDVEVLEAARVDVLVRC